MIVKMKKLSLILYHRDKTDFLKALQGLGIVHIEPVPEVISVELEKAIELHERYERSLNVLREMALGAKGDYLEEPALEALTVLERFDALYSRLNKINSALEELEKTVESLIPWGNFDPQKLKAIEEAGINVRFMETKREDLPGMVLKKVHVEVMNVRREKVYLIVLEKGESEPVPGTQVHPPMRPLGEVLKELNDLKEERKKIKASLERLIPNISRLETCERTLKDRISFHEAELHMREEAGGKVVAMKGWLRHDHERRVRSFLDRFHACYLIEEPAADDKTPVLLKNNRFAKLFEPITRIFSLPSYFELDPTPFFAPFFALFFGLCLADLGYGLIMSAVTAFLVVKGPRRFQSLFMMALVLSLMAAAGGLMLNTFFGEAIFHRPGVERALFTEGDLLAPFAPYREKGKMIFPGMIFALLLGFIQVIIGIILNAVKRARKSGFLYGLQPLSYLMLIMGGLIQAAHADMMNLSSARAGPIEIGEFLISLPPALGKVSLIGGLIILFLFNNPDRKIHWRPLFGLWELYGFATGLMGDILSYLRLFALGLAGALLGNAFNEIAFMIAADGNGLVHYTSFTVIGAGLVLLLGHTLNFGLATLGAFVHSLRLTFVEFYKNLNFEGGGREFKPFSFHNRSGQSS